MREAGVIEALQNLWAQVGPSTIAGIISGVAVAILIATAPKIRDLMTHSWVGGVIAGVVALLILSDFLRGPPGPSLPDGFVVAFAGLECPHGWNEFSAARDRFIVGASSRRPVTPDEDDDGEPEYRRGGAEEVTLTEAQMPAHHHFVRHSDNVDPGQPHSVMTSGQSATFEGRASTRDTDIRGGSQPHENMPPYIALYFCTPDRRSGRIVSNG